MIHYESIKRVVLIIIFCLILNTDTIGQKSVIDIFKSDRTLADNYLERGEIQSAINLYERSDKSGDINLMLARGYFMLKEYAKCIDAYNSYTKRGKSLVQNDYLNYAEAHLVLKNYEHAQENYQKVLAADSSYDWVLKKIWRISNMHYLYEDSVHYATRSLSINTSDAEWGGVPFNESILFLSNRPAVTMIKEIDASTQQSFYKIYLAKEKTDTLLDGWSKLYTKPVQYGKAPAIKGNAGTFAFYDNNTKMVFTATSTQKDHRGVRSMGLYFAELQNGKWVRSSEFEYNKTGCTVTDPAIDNNGKTLYFSSDRSGGFGGRDIYRSEWVNNKWTTPINLGEVINTPMDEVFPHFNNENLYFSSNGHAGMGGLDIYKVEMTGLISEDPINLGYPINSSYDDFAITFTDAKGTHGLLSSNRKRGGLDDDLYEFDIDMQTYPFTITGVIKQMDHSWSDSTNVKPLGNARILLVDNIRNVTILETSADSAGMFSLSIPYFSKYGVHVIDADGIENIAVLDLHRQRKASTIHEIVVIKDIFQTVNK